jgi:diguanylate cyclase (GGDEF)-like protein
MSPPTDFSAAAKIAGVKAIELDPLTRIAQLEAELALRNAEIKELRLKAFYDLLTGLGNFQASQIVSLKLITESCLRNESMALVLFDLDNFKAVNDILLHEKGNEALRIVSEVVKASVGAANVEEEHFASRRGGDEFAIFIQSHQRHQRTSPDRR